MADFRAITAVSEAIRGLLRGNYRRDDFDNDVEFEIYTSRDFTRRLPNGVTLFLYRIYVNGTNRTPPGRIGSDGRRHKTQLPLELHYLLTFWGGEFTLQHALAAWAMRVLEDNPILKADVLNAGEHKSFRRDESVELSPAEMRTEDLLRIWEVLGASPYHLSIPYLARIVPIESEDRLPAPDAGIVQERTVRAVRHLEPGAKAVP